MANFLRFLQNAPAAVIVIGVVACGSPEAASQTGYAALPEPTSTVRLAESAQQSDLPAIDLSATTTSATSVVLEEPPVSDLPRSVGEPKTIEAGDLVLNFTLPADTINDPRPDPAPYEIVVSYDRWLLESCCDIKVVVQNVEPLFSDKEEIDVFESNGNVWKIYDTGPNDGSVVSAWASINGSPVLVSAQVFGTNPDATPAETVRLVAETMTSK